MRLMGMRQSELPRPIRRNSVESDRESTLIKRVITRLVLSL